MRLINENIQVYIELLHMKYYKNMKQKFDLLGRYKLKKTG